MTRLFIKYYYVVKKMLLNWGKEIINKSCFLRVNLDLILVDNKKPLLNSP